MQSERELQTMKLQILLATMSQQNDSILDEMSVTSDVIVCNQNNVCTNYARYERNGHEVRWYNFQEKSVGLNRNNALFRATGDICLLADDDVTYLPEYETTVLEAFRKHPDADVILFNIISTPDHARYITKKTKRIGRHNCGKFGAVRIAFRRMSVIKNAICFNQLFGGGAMFTAGEDTMFIRDCIRKGLKVIAVSDYILKLREDRPSTWFSGYDQKFFEDMGSSYYYHFHSLAMPCFMIQLIRRRNTLLEEVGFIQAIFYGVIGIQKYRRL